MALITLQSPFQLWSGKQGGDEGNVLYSVGGRMVARDMVIPDNPQSTLQSSWRSILTQCAQAYGTTSEAQQAGWDALGAQLPRSDVFSREYRLTGNQAFTAINSRRLAAGQAIVLDAPAYSLVPIPQLNEPAIYDPTEFRFTVPAGTYAPGFLWFRFSNVLPGTARQAREADVATKSDSFADAIVSIPTAGGQIVIDAANVAGLPGSGSFRIGVSVESMSSAYVPGQRFLSGSTDVDYFV